MVNKTTYTLLGGASCATTKQTAVNGGHINTQV